MDDELRRLLIMLIENDEERQVAEFLDKIGLKFVAANSKFYDNVHIPTGEIDLIFTYKNVIFVIEVSIRADSEGRRKRRKKLREWDNKAERTRLAEKHELDKRDTMYMVYIDLSRDKITENLEMQNESDLKNIIVYKQELSLAGNSGGVKTAKEFLDLVIKKAEKIGKNDSN